MISDIPQPLLCRRNDLDTYFAVEAALQLQTTQEMATRMCADGVPIGVAIRTITQPHARRKIKRAHSTKKGCA
ncbi:hypothetical protein [Uliginosibacterium sediminicola]|uniref:Uncharacterized protein n=1 Tax=Uliginosibacterium sediminicola TaxID=2024550 RepID=A0ABU9YW17_9RHOO